MTRRILPGRSVVLAGPNKKCADVGHPRGPLLCRHSKSVINVGPILRIFLGLLIGGGVAGSLLAGCSKRASPPPQALEDAATATQRASAAMRASSNPTSQNITAAKPADGDTQAEKIGKTQ